MKDCVIRVSKESAQKIIDTREPLGLYYHPENGKFIGIDNSYGDAWVEEFSTLEDCLNWLDDGLITLVTYAAIRGHKFKMFRVEKEWLIEIVDDMCAVGNLFNDERYKTAEEGISRLENFLLNYVYDETWFVYIQAKKDGKLIDEKEVPEEA